MTDDEEKAELSTICLQLGRSVVTKQNYLNKNKEIKDTNE